MIITMISTIIFLIILPLRENYKHCKNIKFCLTNVYVERDDDCNCRSINCIVVQLNVVLDNSSINFISLSSSENYYIIFNIREYLSSLAYSKLKLFPKLLLF